MEKKHVQMVNWYFGLRSFYGFMGFSVPGKDGGPDESYPSVLMGNTLGHPKFGLDQAPYVMTSRVLEVDFPNRRVETLNTVYELVGDPHPNWLRWLDERDITFVGVNDSEPEDDGEDFE